MTSRTRILAGAVFVAYAVQLCSAQTCAQIASQYRGSTVFVFVQRTAKDTGAVDAQTGTGFVVSTGGVVLTDNHVVLQDSKTSEILISGALGSREAPRVKLNLLGRDEADDIAMLQLADTSKTYTAVAIGNPWSTSVGDGLCSMGFPLTTEFHTTEGPLGGKGGGHDLWSTQMPSNVGESGAPVFRTSDGTVVALKAGSYDSANNLSYLIPINFASSLLLNYAGMQVPLAAAAPAVAVSTPFQNPTIDCAKSPEPFARDACAVKECPGGQWSRGSAKLVSGGKVQITQGLETDSVTNGVCGWIQFELQDQTNAVVAYGFGPRRCIGGKPPGSARIDWFPPDTVQVPAPIANKVTSVHVSSVCAGSTFAPFGLDTNMDGTKGTASVLIGAP